MITMNRATSTSPARPATKLERMFSAPREGPTVRNSTIFTGKGREPPRSWTSRSLASSELKFPEIEAEPPVMPAALNSGPTVASLIERPSSTIPRSLPVPAMDWVRPANFSPPSRLKFNVTSQATPLRSCWRPALVRSLPVSRGGP